MGVEIGEVAPVAGYGLGRRVDQYHVDMLPADIAADGICGVELQEQRSGGLAAPSAQDVATGQQPILFELRHDGGRRLRREAGTARDVGIRDAGIESYRCQNSAPVGGAQTGMLHAPAGRLKKIGHFADPRTNNVLEADKIPQASAIWHVRISTLTGQSSILRPLTIRC